MGRNRLQGRDRTTIIRKTVSQTNVPVAGPQGPPGPEGPQGPAGSSSGSSGPETFTATAGETLSGHRAVYVAADGKAYYSDPSTANCKLTVGLTTGAATSGTSATIQTNGILVEPSWTWSGNEVVWLATNGTLTQTIPTSGYLFQVGVPVGPTKLRIEPQLIARIT